MTSIGNNWSWERAGSEHRLFPQRLERLEEIEVRNFLQFSAISQFFEIFRDFPQFSAIFRNLSAIFLISRFSDCLPTLVQNSEKKFFFTMPFTL